MKRFYLIACLIVAMSLAVNCKVKSRGNLEYPDNLEDSAGSSYSFNGQPTFQFRNQNNNDLAVDAVNQYERMQRHQQQQQQQQEQEQSAQPVLSRNRNKILNLDAELEELKHELENQPDENNLAMMRDKKSRPIVMVDGAKENENAPILNHGRKTYVAANTDDNNSPRTCSSRLQAKQNMIVDSETSMKRGAKFIGVDYINNQMTIITISGMHDACKQKCCDNEKCDTALLQMKIGDVRFVFAFEDLERI